MPPFFFLSIYYLIYYFLSSIFLSFFENIYKKKNLRGSTITAPEEKEVRKGGKRRQKPPARMSYCSSPLLYNSPEVSIQNFQSPSGGACFFASFFSQSLTAFSIFSWLFFSIEGSIKIRYFHSSSEIGRGAVDLSVRFQISQVVPSLSRHTYIPFF